MPDALTDPAAWSALSDAVTPAIPAIVFVIGLLVGSFTNVLIYRVPEGKDWVRSESHCPRCEKSLRWYDNVPVLAWALWLNRKCRFCKLPIPKRYPLVELLVGVMFLAVYLTWGLSLTTLAFCYLAVISVMAALVDVDRKHIHLGFMYMAVLIGAALVAAGLVWDDMSGGLLLSAVVGNLVFVVVGFMGLQIHLASEGSDLERVLFIGMVGLFAGFLGWLVLGVATLVIVALTVGGQRLLDRLFNRCVSYVATVTIGSWAVFFLSPLLAS